ncbi:MAG: hypothetical protein AAGA68_23185 [Pseudomonadota bacterium]
MNSLVEGCATHRRGSSEWYLAGVTSLLILATAIDAASAASVEVVSFTTMSHQFTVSDGAVPDGVTSQTSGPIFDPFGISSTIDDPEAIVAVDTDDVQIGCASCDPPVPFLSRRQLRTNRVDPTEFSDAQYDISVLALQDQGSDVTFFAMGDVDVDRSGLAQVRITSTPVAAEAYSAYGIARTTTFENTTGRDISFDVTGELDGFVLSRVGGSDGAARTSATFSILFSGLSSEHLSYDDFAGPVISSSEVGAGATVTYGIFDTDDGILGLQFTVGATATDDDGFAEASFDVFLSYIFGLTLGAGQGVDMTFAWTQVNDAQFHPSPIPTPAGAILFASGLIPLIMRIRKPNKKTRWVSR